MVSEQPSSVSDEANVMAEEPVVGFLPSKKNQGKIPKKIHKAEREKLKRDHLNDLFLSLGHALEPARQNNGKASILGDATRLLRDLIAQVEALRKENGALVTESRYVSVEKNELQDETTALKCEIGELQNQLHERMQPSNPMWHHHSSTSDTVVRPTLPAQSTTTALPMPQPSSPSPLFVIPLHHQDLQQAFPEPPATAAAPPKPPSNVRRPHARYPTPSDSWPLQLLSRNQHSDSSTSNSSDSGEERLGETLKD